MSSLTTNNITINKITSSNGKFSGDNASGLIQLEYKGNSTNVLNGVLDTKISIEDGGFAFIDWGNGIIETYNDPITIKWSEKILDYTTSRIIKITGSKISGLSGVKSNSNPGGSPSRPVPPEYASLEDEEIDTAAVENTYNVFKIASFKFPKDSQNGIDCSNLFYNSNTSMSIVYGQLPELDDRISNMDGMFNFCQNIEGDIPKLPASLTSAKEAFRKCYSLTGLSKDLIQQFVTQKKPYIDLPYENMVTGCNKAITSWFSVNCGGDHDVIEYDRYTSSRNATASVFPYIMVTLPRPLTERYNFRVVFKNLERISSLHSTVFSSRDTVGKNSTVFGWTPSNTVRIDSNTIQSNKYPKNIKDIRPSDLTIITKNKSNIGLLEINSTDVIDSQYYTLSNTGLTNTTKILTMFASNNNGVNIANPGKMSIAELDIWDEEGYLIKMRSEGISMKDAVSGVSYSSASLTPFTTENVDIRDIDKEDLYFWEKFSGKTLPLNFWDEYSIALADYKANPTKTEEWTVEFDKTTVTSSSNCPYFTSAPTKPLVNFFLTKCAGIYPGYYNGYPGPHQVPISPFAKGTNQIMYFPNLTSNYAMVAEQTNWQVFPICPKGTNVQSYKTKIPQYVWYKNATGTGNMFSSGHATEVYLLAPNVSNVSQTFTYGSGSQAYLKKIDFTIGKVTTMNNGMNINYSPVELLVMRGDFNSCTNLVKFMIAISASAKTTPIKFVLNDDYQHDPEFKGATLVDQFAQDRKGWTQSLVIPSCSSATNAFLNTSMTARNIAKTLNSLPKWTDGKVHTITFTGCPGIEWEETTETFNGVSNCPRFTKDTEGKALRKAFAKAVTNGWTVEIGTATNAASTMSLRRLQYYKKTESECGDYVDPEGKTYIISTGDAFSNEGKNLGYEQFSSLEECLESWNLTEIPREEPVPFEEFIEEENLESELE